MAREIPPTAGLPLRASDLLPGPVNLAQATGVALGLPSPQLECSGTAALIVALTTLARGSDRRTVIVPAYTCPLVALAVARCGLQLRVCDLAPSHFDLDLAHLAALIDHDTLAVVPTHLGGRVADVASVVALAHRGGAFVVEDAAQALGATIGGLSVGLQGDAGFFSLAAGKGLSIYEGGLLVSASEERRDHFRATHELQVPDRPVWEWRRLLELLGYWAFYRPRGLHHVYGEPLRRALERGDPVGAVGDRFSPDIPVHRVGAWRQMIGSRALNRLPDFLTLTREQAHERRSRLQALGVMVAGDRPGDEGVWPFFMVLMPTEAQRDAALGRLWRRGLGVSRLFIHALCDYDELRNVVPFAEVPRARDFAARMLTISNSPWLDDERFEEICRELARVLAVAD
ncbi:MAG TPA: DegT/DnrJ/EryC1/StrS family aminotransferase [Moraxellaceae bacterium]|nr:DegT/DnrJ/EryC1/StrS family aminotransferase [Moraxellaceae bacterium]